MTQYCHNQDQPSRSSLDLHKRASQQMRIRIYFMIRRNVIWSLNRRRNTRFQRNWKILLGNQAQDRWIIRLMVYLGPNQRRYPWNPVHPGYVSIIYLGIWDLTDLLSIQLNRLIYKASLVEESPAPNRYAITDDFTSGPKFSLGYRLNLRGTAISLKLNGDTYTSFTRRNQTRSPRLRSQER